MIFVLLRKICSWQSGLLGLIGFCMGFRFGLIISLLCSIIRRFCFNSLIIIMLLLRFQIILSMLFKLIKTNCLITKTNKIRTAQSNKKTVNTYAQLKPCLPQINPAPNSPPHYHPPLQRFQNNHSCHLDVNQSYLFHVTHTIQTNFGY